MIKQNSLCCIIRINLKLKLEQLLKEKFKYIHKYANEGEKKFLNIVELKKRIFLMFNVIRQTYQRTHLKLICKNNEIFK